MTVRIAVRRFRHLYAYCTENVWRDPRDVWYVKLLKVVNLSVKSFFDKNIQTLASSLTYTTLLAVIPILSLLLAIARGFGMRDVLIQSLYKGLPSQRAMLENWVSRNLVGINFRHPNVMPNFAVWKTITYRHWHKWCCQPRF